jgi:hypothetical protein
MDEEHERLLARIRQRTGWSASDALKRGLASLDRELDEKPPASPFELYAELDLGPGGYASGPAARSGQAARNAIMAKRRPR